MNNGACLGPRGRIEMQAYKHKLTYSERKRGQEQALKEKQLQKALQSEMMSKKSFQLNKSYISTVINTFFAIDDEDLKEAKLYNKEHGIIMTVLLLLSAVVVISLYTYLNNKLF